MMTWQVASSSPVAVTSSWSFPSQIMTRSPYTLQLRYMQTLSEIATEQNSTILFPLPIDLVAPILNSQRENKSGS